MNTQKEVAITSLFIEYQKLRETSEENYEFINGEIIKMHSPSIKHQDIVLNLVMELKQYFKGTKCKTMISPTDIYLEKDNIKKEICVIPDISVMCEQSGFDEKRYHGVPTIIVEVLSSNWADDMIKKFKLYQEFGVLEYWIIDPSSESFMVYSYDTEEKNYHNVIQRDNELCSKLFCDLKINMEEIF
ncbi:Uma2 family endonuclease [Clostridium gasigenes]|uniref:Endonuclease, Uma2 family (Restriction endonuclease fold) n=1 Tax=Clostridium gasigenes TaxID=94869 RepID=A0A1H0UN60_9CLOT|nr:Uma2 family endonuclease [Clostridium gasigenes]SDP67296.1 Endonuclease, Uma2 family (restriction endonuclease fold) [Clostridium gasigenes]